MSMDDQLRQEIRELRTAVARLVEAAGGEIVLEDRYLLDAPPALFTMRNPISGQLRFYTRRPPR